MEVLMISAIKNARMFSGRSGGPEIPGEND
jgi:hypothetical protein